MEDVLTGQIVDYFGGQEDLKRGIVRHVNDATFAEDPLRVLRAAQFAARFGFSVAKETVALCRTMDLTMLAGERIYGELEKALMKAPRPSVFFEMLYQMGQLGHWFPQVEALIGILQDSLFHPEGDVWNHTMLVLDQAAKLKEQAKDPEAFLSRLTREKRIHIYVANMVELHMRPNIMAEQKSHQKSFCRLFDRSVCPEDLLLIAKADALGREIEQDYAPIEAYLQKMISQYREIMSLPFVRGADLEAAGFKPGKDFGPALAYAHKMRLVGVAKEDALRQTVAYLQKERNKEIGGKNI